MVKSVRPTPRDRHLLFHVFRYGLTTADVVYKVFVDTERFKRPTADTLLQRHKRDTAFLEPHSSHGLTYWRLTAKGTRYLRSFVDVPQRAKTTGSLASKMFVERYAKLAFCCLAETQRLLLMQHEFCRYFAEFHSDRVPADSYYIHERKGASVLCRIIVDTPARVDSQAKRLRHCIRMTKAGPATLRELVIRQGRFRLAYLSTTEERANELRRAFSGVSIDEVDVFVVPELRRVVLEEEHS